MTDQPLDLHDIDPPADLIERLICDTGSYDVVHVLEALTIWADGALIDPQTWQRYDRTEVEVGTEWQGSGYLSYEVPIIEWPTEPWESKPVDQPLFTLTPRSDR